MPYKDKEYGKYWKREHYLDNKEEYAWTRDLWRMSNPERYKELNKKYYEEHKEKVLKRRKQWDKNHPERAKLNYAKQWKRRKDFRNCVRRLQYKLDKMYGVVKK